MGRRSNWGRRPERFHAAVGLGLAALTALALLVPFRHHAFHWFHFLGAWLAGINLTTFGYYGYDKARARAGLRRVPEVVLHLLALAGGSPAAWLAMRTFRHKTVKGSFRLAFWLVVAVQLLLAAWVAWLLWLHHR
jgi:uncharacterized membrane protein YsdA (DUF1294 family)